MADWYLIGPTDEIAPEDLIWPDGIPDFNSGSLAVTSDTTVTIGGEIAPVEGSLSVESASAVALAGDAGAGEEEPPPEESTAHGPVLTATGASSHDRRPDVVVLLKAVDGAWMAVGPESVPGVFPEQVTASANEAGPDTASFLLRRRASLAWPDLTAFNQAEVIVDGSPVWGGRVWEAPVSSGNEDTIAVQGRGWQYHLDDDQLQRMYVRSDLSGWTDRRSHLQTDIAAYFRANGQVANGAGGMNLTWPGDGALLRPANFRVGAFIDGGYAGAIKRIVVNYTPIALDATAGLYVSNDDTPWSDLEGTFHTTTIASTSPATFSKTFTTARRYVTVAYVDSGGTDTVPANDSGVQINSIQVFAATAYESGGVSVLTADTVAEEVLASGAVPLLSQSTHLIDTASFAIQHLAPDGYQTPRQIIDAANAYEGNLFGVNAQREVFFRERDTEAVVEVGPWGGFQFQDATSNSAEQLYNRVIVQGTGPDGAPVSEVRTATSSLLTRQGFTRTAILNVSAAVTPTAAQTLGDVWLREMSTPKFKGTVTVQGHGACRTIIGGDPLHPSQLLHYGGRMIRLPIVDPETGAWTRDCLIRSVSYSHDSETATLELDNERGNFATLLQRYGVDVGQALARVR